MRLNFFASSSLAFAACALVSTSAAAFGNYVGQIPNGNANSCLNCHVSPNGGPDRNAFGTAVEGNGGPQWADLYSLDSDGDGQTNGEELGDPCGDWTGGAAPRTTDISRPGDDADTSADPTTPDCVEVDAGVVVDAGEPEDDAGTPAEPAAEPAAEPEPSPSPEPDMPICTCVTPSSGVGFSGLALFVVGFTLIGRRRKR